MGYARIPSGDSDSHPTFSTVVQSAPDPELIAVLEDDVRWLLAHPEAESRERLVTAVERRLTGQPAGAIVHVVLLSDGGILRIFQAPRTRR